MLICSNKVVFVSFWILITMCFEVTFRNEFMNSISTTISLLFLTHAISLMQASDSNKVENVSLCLASCSESTLENLIPTVPFSRKRLQTVKQVTETYWVTCLFVKLPQTEHHSSGFHFQKQVQLHSWSSLSEWAWAPPQEFDAAPPVWCSRS